MDKLIREVLDRYIEGRDGTPLDSEQSWVEHMEQKSKGYPRTQEILMGMLKNKGLGHSFPAYNPYDYTSPSDKPKDIGDSAPFVNNVPPEIDYGLFNTPPNVFGDHGALEEWYKSRRIDWTDDPTEQNPAISLDRRYASDVLALHCLHNYPLVISEIEFDDLGKKAKLAASFDEIVGADHHYKNDYKVDRSGACRVTWFNQNNVHDKERGFFVFRVNCSPSSNTHTVYVQFLRGDQEREYQSYAQYPVQLACTCMSFLYYGAQYYAVQGKYMYMPAFRPSLLPPKMQGEYTTHYSLNYPGGKKHPGRGLNFRACKHILAVYNQIKNFKIEKYYKRYPTVSPPSAVINRDTWKDLMKFEFNEANIKQRLKSERPKIPAYFRREDITQSVIDWFNNVWIPRTDDQKIKALKDMVEFPERIFFVLMKEAYLKRSRGERISDRLINEGYDLMSKTIQPDNSQEPEVTPEAQDFIENQEERNRISPPGGNKPADEFIKNVSIVKPAIKDNVTREESKEPPLKKKQRQIAKKLRGVKRSS